MISQLTINNKNMDVSCNRHLYKHLVSWLNSQKNHLRIRQPQQIDSLEAAWKFGIVNKICVSLAPEYFVQTMEDSGSSDIISLLEKYIQKQMGKCIRKRYKKQYIENSMTDQQCLRQGIQLLMYICMHSDHKNKASFVNRVLTLAQDDQINLMASLKNIENKLQNIVATEDFLIRISDLQIENQLLRKEIESMINKDQLSQTYIKELQLQKKDFQQEVQQNKREKQKIYQTLKINHFSDYLSVCLKIQEDNLLMNQYINELEKKNNTLDQSYRDLQKSFGDRSVVIAELSDEIVRVKERYNLLKVQRESQENFDLDISKSFGNHPLQALNPNSIYYSTGKRNHLQQNQSLLDISYINNKRDSKCPNFIEWCLQPDFIASKQNLDDGALEIDDHISQNQAQYEINTVVYEQLQEQNRELRKHTTDLMQKLEDTYKTVQSLSSEASRYRQINKKLEKENKLYQKKLRLLKQLNKEFQRRFQVGQI